MPIQFDGIIAEHGYCRNDVALFDTSHMGELFFTGDIKTSGINEATTVNIEALPVGKCKYGFLLNDKGGVYDDNIQLLDSRLPENRQGLRNGLAQQILHTKMVDEQYKERSQ